METHVHITPGLALLLFIMFTGGQAIHLFLFKIQDLKMTAKTANKKFYFSEWWSCDWNIFIGTQVLGVIITVGLDEIVQLKPEVWDHIKWFYFLIGFGGSYALMNKLSKYAKGQFGILDIKANTFDIMTGGATTVKEAIDKGTALTGQEVTKAPDTTTSPNP